LSGRVPRRWCCNGAYPDLTPGLELDIPTHQILENTLQARSLLWTGITGQPRLENMMDDAIKTRQRDEKADRGDVKSIKP